MTRRIFSVSNPEKVWLFINIFKTDEYVSPDFINISLGQWEILQDILNSDKKNTMKLATRRIFRMTYVGKWNVKIKSHFITVFARKFYI